MFRSAAVRLSALALAVLATAASAQQAKYSYSSEHREAEQAIPQTVASSAATSSKLSSKLAASRTGTSMAVADFDADGYPDLITGYSTPAGGVLLLQRGAKAAHAPGPNEWAAKAAGKLVSPYKEKAEPIDLPVSPDFLLAADISGHGNQDLATAAKGDSTVYVLFGRNDGTFTAPTGVALQGAISSLATWRGAKGTNYLVAGVCGAAGCGLQFIDADGSTAAFVRTPAAATTILTGRIDEGILDDLAIVANARPMVFEGDSVLGTSPVMEKLPTTGTAAIALGRYVMDSRPMLQIAALGTDATLHIITRTGVDDTLKTVKSAHKGQFTPQERKHLAAAVQAKVTGTAWQEVETVSNVGSGGAAMMLRAHLLGSGLDDLAVIAGTQYTTVAHRLSTEGNRTVTTPVVTADSTASPVQAAMPARVSADARHGMVLLGSGPRPLVVAQPTTYKTYYVTTTTDADDNLTTTARCNYGSGIQCTLRDAVNLTNVDSASNRSSGKIDVVNVPAGTYNLTVDNPTRGTTTPASYDLLGSVNYHLELDAPIVLNGAGSGTGSNATIINMGNADQALSIDGGAYYSTGNTDYEPIIMDAFVTNLTVENATNTNSYSNSACSATEYCNIFGGAISWLSEGTTSSNLVLSNVWVIGSTTESNTSGGFTGGGGIEVALDNGTSTTVSGPLDIENSTFTGDKDRTGYGGGAVYDFQYVPVTINGSTFSSNTTTDGADASQGGALYFYPTNSTTAMNITNSTFIANSAPLDKGGAISNVDGLLNITGSTFGSNYAKDYGGAIYFQQVTGQGASSLLSSSFTTNNLTGLSGAGETYQQDGAGVCIEGGSSSTPGQLTVAYNRFHGNTVTRSGAATGVALGCQTSSGAYGNVVLNNNWWGCNGLATGTGCDTAHNGNFVSGTFTLATYTSLLLNLSASTINYGSPVVATASLGQNNGGTIYTAANDAAYLATPITTFTLTDTTTPTYSPSATAFSSSAATGTSYAAATATGNGNTGGTGTATLTVDGTTITRSYTVNGPPDLTFGAVTAQTVKAGSTGNAYALMVYNSGGSPTTSNVSLTDTLPSGFTATAISGTNWSCAALPALSCTYVLPIASSGNAPPLTITYTASSTPGSYQDSASVSGGGEVSSGNDSLSIGTSVEGAATIAEAFSPANVAAGTNSTVTFSLGNPSPNPVALTGVAFTDSLPTGLVVSTPNGASTTCTSGTVTATAGSSSIALSGASINANATCTVTVNVVASAVGTYTNTTSAVASTNGTTGGTASATLTVNDTTTTVVTLGATTGTVGGTTTLSAKVTDTTNTGATPTGTVTFSNTVNGTTTSLGSYPLTGNTASTTYNESYGGTNVITATFTPSSSTYGASADATGKTITVAKASPAQITEVADQTVQSNVASNFTIIFTYPGKVPPTGAISVTFNGTALAVTPTCVYKTAGNPHSNCSFTYTTTLPAGNYTLAYTQAADNNYNQLSGSSIITVTN